MSDHFTDERISGTIVNGAGGRLLLDSEGEGFPIHFVDIDSMKLQVGDRISGSLFVYNTLTAGFNGYVYPGSIKRL
ncbi:hypothetical protein ACKFKG_10840 [Phormidesmis sp. 146-35]